MNAKWKIIKKIGQGGNGIVFEVANTSDERFAMKVLKKVKFDKYYKRFKNEIEVLNQLKDKKGVIQIIDYFLPDKKSDENNPYYVMPIGIKLADYVKSKSNEDLYKIVFDLSDSLVELHKNDITHRDIKPDNILIVNNNPVFSDFGLANFPTQERVSERNEKIGPKWSIAPEMKRISSTSEYKKADIYSFAKTIWMLITKQWWGFEGQYVPNSSISIDNYVEIMINKSHWSGVWYYHSIVLLNQLFIDSTDNDPNKRPNAEDFNKRIKYWYLSCDDYDERNPYEWIDAIKRIFPVSIPISCSWTKIEEIINVLKIISGGYDNLNHAFLPPQGGNDFTEIESANEKECILINKHMIIKPKVLIFEFMEDFDWSYFRIELENLNCIGENEDSNFVEHLYLAEDGNYTEDGDYSDISVERYLKGSIVIVKKTSLINNLSAELDGYTGFHNSLTNEEYKSKLLNVQKNLLAYHLRFSKNDFI